MSVPARNSLYSKKGFDTLIFRACITYNIMLHVSFFLLLNFACLSAYQSNDTNLDDEHWGRENKKKKIIKI